MWPPLFLVAHSIFIIVFTCFLFVFLFFLLWFAGAIGSLSIAIGLIVSPVTITYCRRKSTRLLAVIGGLVLTLGCLFTSFAQQYHQVLFSYGKIKFMFTITHTHTHTPHAHHSNWLQCGIPTNQSAIVDFFLRIFFLQRKRNCRWLRRWDNQRLFNHHDCSIL